MENTRPLIVTILRYNKGIKKISIKIIKNSYSYRYRSLDDY